METCPGFCRSVPDHENPSHEVIVHLQSEKVSILEGPRTGPSGAILSITLRVPDKVMEIQSCFNDVKR